MLIADESSCFSTVKISPSIENEVVFNEARIVFVFAVLISAVGMRSFSPNRMKPAFRVISCSVTSSLLRDDFTLNPIRANSSIKVV